MAQETFYRVSAISIICSNYLIPGSNKPSYFFDPRLLRLSMTMTSQSLVKHFLTEGDKLILSYFSPLQDQGGYAVAVNYGQSLYIVHILR